MKNILVAAVTILMLFSGAVRAADKIRSECRNK
jgi:hypothetical protein